MNDEESGFVRGEIDGEDPTDWSFLEPISIAMSAELWDSALTLISIEMRPLKTDGTQNGIEATLLCYQYTISYHQGHFTEASVLAYQAAETLYSPIAFLDGLILEHLAGKVDLDAENLSRNAGILATEFSDLSYLITGEIFRTRGEHKMLEEVLDAYINQDLRHHDRIPSAYYALRLAAAVEKQDVEQARDILKTWSRGYDTPVLQRKWTDIIAEISDGKAIELEEIVEFQIGGVPYKEDQAMPLLIKASVPLIKK